MICSDNGTTFKGASRLVDTLWEKLAKEESWQEWISKHHIQWHSITSLAPLRGGYYERLVGVVKGSINETIGRRILTLEAYSTLICEAEAIVNTRPLTFLYNDSQSLVLRPIDFQLLNKESFLPAFTDDGNDPTYLPPSDSMLVNYQKTGRIVNKFLRIWENEYLQSLRDKHSHTKQHLGENLPQV